jgi:hypothetical protein
MSTVLLLLSLLVVLVTPQDPDRFDMGLFLSPSKGETASKGEFLVYHKGEGKPGKSYFKEHQPGEIAEFHLFVPEAAARQTSKRKRSKQAPKKLPLFIVYHGGKDGGSGRGFARRMSKLSTKEHPVIVLSPNMYTLDSYRELLEEGKYPIDEDRVFVMGFSSGGMGVLTSFKEGSKKDATYHPRMIISMSTTASNGRNPYPDSPYVVVAGEKETPEYAKHPLLKTRRQTCRRHALTMQTVIKDVNYVEVPGVGHSGGSPMHLALLQNLMRSFPAVEIDKKLGKISAEFDTLAALARSGRWKALAEARSSLGSAQKKSAQRRFRSFDRKLLVALRYWLDSEVKSIAKLDDKSSRLMIMRALKTEELFTGLVKLFEGSKWQEHLTKSLARLESNTWFQRELEARKQYREIAAQPPGEESKKALRELKKEFKGTVFGDHRAQQMLLAYEL